MIAAILEAISGGIWPYLAAGVTALIGAGALYFKGRTDARRAVKINKLEADNAAHKRINEADLGTGTTDRERIKRLRRFDDKHGD